MVIRLTPEQAAKHILPDRKPRTIVNVPKHGDPVKNWTEQLFDASRMFDGEELDHTTKLLHHRFISESGNNYLAIENALRDATMQLQHLTLDINRSMWGCHDWAIKRAPTKAQQATIPQMLAERAQRFPNLERKARHAHVLRTFAAALSEALEVAKCSAVADAQTRGDRAHDDKLRAEFEAYEVTAKERRFQDWRARR